MSTASSCKVYRFVLGALVLCTVAFIFAMSLQNAEASANESSRVLLFVNGLLRKLNIGYSFSHNLIRFLAHFGEFFILGFLAYYLVFTYRPTVLHQQLFPIMFSLLIAVIDEIIQLFSDGRAFQITDILTDLSGACTAVMINSLLLLIISFLKRRKDTKNG